MRIFKLLSVIAISCVMAACGGGSGAGSSNGSLVISAPATVAAGKVLTLSVTFSSPSGVMDQPITVTSNSTSVASGTANTNNAGVAVFNLATTNNLTTDRDIILTARAGSIIQSTKVKLLANKVVVSAAAGSVTFAAGTVGMIVPVGDFVQYTDGDGLPLAGQTIAISVDNLTPLQGVGAADVLWDGVTSFTPQVPISRITDAQGKIPATTFTVVSRVPATSSQSTTVTIRFKFVVSVPLGAQIVQYQDVAYTFTAQ